MRRVRLAAVLLLLALLPVLQQPRPTHAASFFDSLKHSLFFGSSASGDEAAEEGGEAEQQQQQALVRPRLKPSKPITHVAVIGEVRG